MNSFVGGLVLMVPLLLAQMPSASDTKMGVQWLVGAAAAAVMFNQVAQAWKTMTGKFSKMSEPEGGYRTRHDCIEIHKALHADRVKVQDGLAQADTALRLELREDIKGIHRRIDDVLTAVANIGGQQ